MQVDLRNLNCPEPVLRTKKLFDDPNVETVEALVDDEVSVRNLERLSKYLKATVRSKQIDKGFQVTLSRLPDSEIQTSTLYAQEPEPRRGALHAPSTSTVVFLSKDTLGQGDEEFSRTLLNLFLQTLFETGQKPQAILMANSGVKLMAKNSPVLKVLQDFYSQGVEVAACGLCVDYYGLKEDVPVKQITNMFAICEYLASAQKVLTP